MKDFGLVVKDILAEKGAKDASSSQATDWRGKTLGLRLLGRRFLGRISNSTSSIPQLVNVQTGDSRFC